MALALNVEQLIIRGDSKVVFGHVTRSFEAKESHMKKYTALVKGLIKEFAVTWFEKIDRKGNRREYELSKVIAGEPIQGLWLEPLLRKSIDVEVLLAEVKSKKFFKRIRI